LTAIPEAFVRLSFTGPVKPVEITGQDTIDAEKDFSYRYLVVPFRLPE